MLAVLHKRKQEKHKADKKQADKKGALEASGASTTSLLLRRKPTEEQVNEAWARAVVKKGLPLDLVDDDEFRSAITMTARAGLSYMDAKTDDCKLPHRTKFTSATLRQLDEKLDEAVSVKIDGLINHTGALLISDGWTSIQNRPIINALLSTPAGCKFLKALDTSGDAKDAAYIKEFVCEILETNPHVVAVCMDGACRSSFPLIREEYPHVFTYICPAHSLDNFLKNVCCNKDEIRVMGVKTADDDRAFDWGFDVFSKPIATAWEVIKFITNHGKPLAVFRDLAADQSTWGENKAQTCELLKYAETRFASKLLMLQRYLLLQPVVEQLIVNPSYKLWLSKQKREIKESGAIAKETVQDEDHWDAVRLTVKVLTPVLKLLRMTDGKTGATLGKIYHQMCEISGFFENPIEGLEEDCREQVWQLFNARWQYFHEPIFTAAYYLDPEFISGEGSKEEEADFRRVLQEISKSNECPHSASDMVVQWAAIQTAISVGSHGLNEELAFSSLAKKMPAFEWARAFMYEWPAIQWVAQRVASLSCSASGCEHSWSIEGWVHSKKRNRLGQTLVERLVRAHTNILLGNKLEEWVAPVLPWELEMIIDDPEPDSD